MIDFIKSALEHLSEREGYECRDILGKGTYGSVVKLIGKDGTAVAAKIVENRVVNTLEIREWSQLDHENVLRLLETIFSAEGVVIFITELMNSNLFSFLHNKEFKTDPQALEKCWLFTRQVLSGVAYLHGLRLCHLDLRAENVFVATDGRAVVADFSGLTYSHEMKKFCPLPHSLRPPEMLVNKRTRVAPTPIDLWSCGLLIAHMFMGRGYYILTLKNAKAGHVDAVIQYTDCFRSKKYVSLFISQTYPNCKLSNRQVQELITLISSFLQICPKLRISSSDALKHSFLSTSLIETPSDTSTISNAASASEEPTICPTEVPVEVLSPTQEEELLKSCLSPKRKKSKWTKFRPSFQNIRKLYISSPPLFRTRKSKIDKNAKIKCNKSVQTLL